MRPALFGLLLACQAPASDKDSASVDTAAEYTPCPELPWYADADGDGWGDADLEQRACEAPAGQVERAGDCDDADPSVHPEAEERCDGLDDDCDGLVDDEDGAVADGSLWYLDQDGDGYAGETYTRTACAAPEGWLAEPADCDDADPEISPEAEERCDGVDTNCDGVADPDPLWEANWEGSYTLQFSGGTMGYAFDVTCTGALWTTVDYDGTWSAEAFMESACCEDAMGECFIVTLLLADHDGGAEAWGEADWEGDDAGTWEGTWTSPTCASPGALSAEVEGTLYFVPFWTYVWFTGSFTLWQET